MQPEFTNRLATQTSPYLLQHAQNPVDWHPWGEEALTLARKLDKPILLSIGYSACHWCHVMAHESFEDTSTAEVMNRLFVNIKVDREERPDLDKIYQFAHQVLAQRAGGWPLTVILTPDNQTPFFAGTYFPRQPRYNMPSFVDVITQVEQFYRQRREDIDQQNSALMDVFRQVEDSHIPGDAELTPIPIDEARRQLGASYDELYAGFGDAPKFPHPSNIERLLRHWASTMTGGNADKTALDMALTTLKAMALGGVYDQLGGGFYRYSTDQEWMIPHFEKMLYDNGPLLGLYCHAAQISGDALYKRIALETAEWVVREMQSTDGGYFSTLDADSEGEEGRFYTWMPEEAKGLLDENQFAVFSSYYGLDRQANFEGKWHLHVYESLENIAGKLGRPVLEVRELLSEAKQCLFRVREQRVKPGRDEKTLTSWNGLMMKGMVLAGRVLQRSDYIKSAEQALSFIQSTLWKSSRLLATCKDGKAHLNAYLDDYVFLLSAVLELLQTRWCARNLQFAIELMDTVLDKFEDRKNGGFYFTSDDHEHLIQRPKVLMDEATPSGYGVTVLCLIRLGHLLGEQRYLGAAERALRAAWENVRRTPYAHNSMLDALEEFIYPTETVVIRGVSEELLRWHQRALKNYSPRRYCIAIPNDVETLPGILGDRKAEADTVAYVCQGRQCLNPVSDFNDFSNLLSANEVVKVIS